METIVKNVTTSDIFIEDLGILISVSESLSILTFGFTKADLDSSSDLKSFVSAGEIIINDGTIDLSVEDGLEHLSLQSVYADDQDNPGIVPSGGFNRQVLIKASDQSFDMKWCSVNNGVLITDPIVVPMWVKTESRYWECKFVWTFPGTIALGDTPTKLDILHKVDLTGMRGYCWIRQAGNPVAIYSNLVATDWTTTTDISLNHITEQPSIWEVMMRVSASHALVPLEKRNKIVDFLPGYAFRIASMTLRFD